MEKYSTLKWSKSQMIKISDPAFDHFLFGFKTDSSTGFIRLEGLAFDGSGDALGSPFRPSETTKPPRPLPNTFKGTFKLDKATLKKFGINGSFDCFLSPRKSHEGEPDERKYVSYRVTNKDPGLAFTAFSMNPSPPYNSGDTSLI